MEESSKKVSITIDDLPGASFPRLFFADERNILEINGRIVSTLARFSCPAVGFAAAESTDLCAIPPVSKECLEQVIEFWLSNGLEIGNHTQTHQMLDDIGAEEFCREILLAHETLGAAPKKHKISLRYFRHPYLRTGSDKSHKDKVAAYLKSQNYNIAPTTIFAEDWVFAEAYARAHEHGDLVKKSEITERYLEFTDQTLSFFEGLSNKVLGYQVKQILLLHNSLLNADCLASLLQLFLDRGYGFISLKEALTDPAYRLGDPYVGQESLTWIERWALSTPYFQSAKTQRTGGSGRIRASKIRRPKLIRPAQE